MLNGLGASTPVVPYGSPANRRADFRRSLRLDVYRRWAIGLLLLSWLLLCVLGTALQYVLYHYRYVNYSYHSVLPGLTKLFLNPFATYGQFYFAEALRWLWWPMLWVTIAAHLRRRSPRGFAISFFFGLAACWLVVAIVLAGILLILMVPYDVLLTEMHKTLPIRIITTVSWLLPLATFLACFMLYRRARR
jgi:hypothetical protein